MASKTLTTIVIILACIIVFPLAIGLIGGAFGIIMGVFGAVFGVMAGVFSAIFGTIGGLFGWIFGGCHLGFFHWNMFPLIVFIVIIIALTRRPHHR